MRKHVVTNIDIDEDIYISFRGINYKKGKKIGRAIGELIEAEVKKHGKVIKGE